MTSCVQGTALQTCCGLVLCTAVAKKVELEIGRLVGIRLDEGC